MARVLKGSHSLTCTPRVHPITEWTIPAFAFPAEADPGGMEGWVGLGYAGWAFRNRPRYLCGNLLPLR